VNRATVKNKKRPYKKINSVFIVVIVIFFKNN